jgi:hypothetical protein
MTLLLKAHRFVRLFLLLPLPLLLFPLLLTVVLLLLPLTQRKLWKAKRKTSQDYKPLPLLPLPPLPPLPPAPLLLLQNPHLSPLPIV